MTKNSNAAVKSEEVLAQESSTSREGTFAVPEGFASVMP
jgi:hypothetical protein